MNFERTTKRKPMNEAYENMLLERFDFKNFLDKAIEASRTLVGAVKDAEIDRKTAKAYRLCRKFITLVLDEIAKTKGSKEAVKFLNQLEDDFREDLKQYNMTPKQMLKHTYMTAIGILSMASVSTIYHQANEDAGIPEDKIMNITTVSPSDETATADKIFIEDSNENDRFYDMDPIVYFQTTHRMMTPSKKCEDFIKQQEVLCLFPYYVKTRKSDEFARGIITIGYGHVLTFNFRDPKAEWKFPNTIPVKRQQEIKRQVLAQINAGHLKPSLCRNGVNTNKHALMPDIITKQEAELFFKKDIADASRKVRLHLFQLDTDDHTKYKGKELNRMNAQAYCYYNQNIFDAFCSCYFNIGSYLKDNPFLPIFRNCKYNENTHMLLTHNFLQIFDAFKTSNPINKSRSAKEYETFGLGKLSTMKNFNDVITNQ